MNAILIVGRFQSLTGLTKYSLLAAPRPGSPVSPVVRATILSPKPLRVRLTTSVIVLSVYATSNLQHLRGLGVGLRRYVRMHRSLELILPPHLRCHRRQ